MEAYRRARMVLSATEDNDDVTPVYRLDEICDLCRSSPPDVVKDVVDHVMRRVDHRSPYVKQKALRLIKYASAKAGPDFKRDIQRHSGTIRGLFHHKGQLDPLKGDAPNKAVRETAHETVQAMFSNEAPPSGGGTAYPHRKMEGFGSTGSRDPGVDSARGGAGFTGMISAGMKELETAVMSKGGLKDMVNSAVNVYSGRGSRKSFLSEENDRGSFRPPRENEGLYGGGGRESWGGGGGYSGGGNHGQGGGGYDRSNGSFGRSDIWTDDRADGEGGEDDVSADIGETRPAGGAGSEEERLVEGITAPGGVRPSPTREALQAFMHAAATLDGGAIARSLEGKLRSHRWQVRFRALCVIEALQRQDAGSGPAAIKEHFRAQPAAVSENLDSPQASVREKAKKILATYGLGDSAPLTPSSPAATPPPVADLLDVSGPDFSNTNSNAFVVAPPQEDHKPQPSTPAKPSSDLLGVDFWSGGSEAPPPSENQTSGGGDLFSGLTVGPSEPAQKQGGEGGSSELFAGMNLEGGGPAPSSSAPQGSDDPFGLSAPAATGADSLSDLMGGLSVAPPLAGASTPGGSNSAQKAAPQKQPLPPMPMPGFENAQWQQPQGLQGIPPQQMQGLVPPQQMQGLVPPQQMQGFAPPQQMPGMLSMGPQQMTPQQMQQMQMAYLHQMQQRGMLMPGMMPFPVGGMPQAGFGQGLVGGFGGFVPKQPSGFGQGVHQNGGHFGGPLGGGLQPSGGSLGSGTFSSLGAGGSGDLFQNAGIAHSQENKAETKAFDFIADQLKTAKTGKSMR